MSDGRAVDTVDDAVAAAEAVGYPVVVKAQVQVGGRGKAGGIKLADSADEVRQHAADILARTVARMPDERDCPCGTALQDAILTQPDGIPEAVRRRLEPIIGHRLAQS